MSSGLYTAAMLAELVGVHVSRVRSWQRRGWIVAVEQKHRLAYFDFQELTVARQLAGLAKAGATPKLIAKKLGEVERQFPDVSRPLAELSLVLDGRSLLVRRGGELVEPGGQLRIDFDALALELDEDYVEARVNLACLLLELGEKDLAIAALEGALRSHEAYADAHYHLARTLDELGRLDEAIAHWQRFADLAPDSPWADQAQ